MQPGKEQTTMEEGAKLLTSIQQYFNTTMSAMRPNNRKKKSAGEEKEEKNEADVDCDGEKQESRAWTYSKVALLIDRREQGKGELDGQNWADDGNGQDKSRLGSIEPIFWTPAATSRCGNCSSKEAH
jgi:hypothetical protein